jgi:choline dehydrogenase-like flavoprotein
MRDVIVVGAGGGGAVVAKELAERGLDVLLLEGGPRFDRLARDWTHFEVDANHPFTGFLRAGPSDRAARAWRRELPQNSVLLQVAGVGGTTSHYFGNSPRAMPGAFLGYRGADRDLYGPHTFPFGYRELVPYYERVEHTLPVQTAAMGRKEEIFFAGAQRLGLPVQTTKDITRAAFRPQENAILQPRGFAGRTDDPRLQVFPISQGCTFCGHCFQGCFMPLRAPVNLTAKRATTVSYIPMALTADRWAHGGKAITLIADAFVVRIEVDNADVARGVTWRTGSGAHVTEDARVVVLAAGAVETPRLWLNSRPGGLPNPNDQVGRGLTDHFQDVLLGVVPFDSGLSEGPASGARVDFPGRGSPVLTVVVNGNGSVTSDPPGIDCGSDCSELYPSGTQVRLIAAPGPGFGNGSFGGDADCADGIVTLTRSFTCTLSFVPTPGSGWQQLGTPLTDRSGVVPTFSLALDDDRFREPVVAYVEASPPTDPARLYVKRLNGAVWETLGSGALNAGSQTGASDPSVMTRFGTPTHVAWSQGNGVQQNIFVARFNGVAWESVGPAGVPLNYAAGSRSVRPALAFDADGRPQVAWIEDGAVKFKRFDGTAWIAAANGAEGPASANADRVQLGTTPFQPVLAWTEGSVSDRKLKVAHGQGFALLGAQVNAPFDVAVAITHFGMRPEENGAIVLWTQDERPFAVFARRWDGSFWADYGVPPVSTDTNLLQSFALARQSLTVAFSLQPLASASFASVYQGSASAWAGVPALGAPLRNLALEVPTRGAPIVAGTLRDANELHELRLYRYFP